METYFLVPVSRKLQGLWQGSRWGVQVEGQGYSPPGEEICWGWLDQVLFGLFGWFGWKNILDDVATADFTIMCLTKILRLTILYCTVHFQVGYSVIWLEIELEAGKYSGLRWQTGWCFFSLFFHWLTELFVWIIYISARATSDYWLMVATLVHLFPRLNLAGD